MRTSKAFIILSIAGLLAILSSTMSKSPTLPLFAKQLGVSEGELGFIAAASTITGIIVNITAGALSDIYGRKKLLIASGFFFASSPFLYLVVTDAWQLALIRAYHGIATATFTPVAMASIADMYKSRRGEMMGIFSSTTMIGRLLAPSIAGALLSLASFKEAYLTCGLAGLAAFIALFNLPAFEVEKNFSRKEARKASPLIFSSNIITASSIMAVTYFAMQSLETFLPIYMGKLGIDPWLIGLTFTIQLLIITILKPYAGRLSDRIGRVKTITVGILISSAGIMGTAFSNSYLTLITFIGVFAVGVAFTTASTPPLISELASEEKHGAAIGAMETIKDIGQASGPIVTGIMLSYAPFETTLTIISILLIAFLPIFYMKLKFK